MIENYFTLGLSMYLVLSAAIYYALIKEIDLKFFSDSYNVEMADNWDKLIYLVIPVGVITLWPLALILVIVFYVKHYSGK